MSSFHLIIMLMIVSVCSWVELRINCSRESFDNLSVPGLVASMH
jgi:hypothetical protein